MRYLAGEQWLDLNRLSQERFGRRVSQLTWKEASVLLDALLETDANTRWVARGDDDPRGL